MKEKNVQDLDSKENPVTKREKKTKKVETATIVNNVSASEVKGEDIASDMSSTEHELHPEEAIKSMVETEQLINEIEKNQEKRTEQDYELMSREQLVDILEKTVKVDDINSIKTEIVLIKVTFLKKEKEEKEAQLNKFLESGGKKEDYNFAADHLTERFNTAFTIYKGKKARFNEELEKQKQENLAINRKSLMI